MKLDMVDTETGDNSNNDACYGKHTPEAVWYATRGGQVDNQIYGTIIQLDNIDFNWTGIIQSGR